MARSQWLAVVGLVVVACSGSTADAVSIELVAGASPERPQARSFAFAGDELGIDSPVVVVQAGEPVVLTVENTDVVQEDAHDFAVVVDKDAERSEWDYLWGAQTPVLAVGESASIRFTPDVPGTYFYVCTIPGHTRRGMWGEFVVEG